MRSTTLVTFSLLAAGLAAGCSQSGEKAAPASARPAPVAAAPVPPLPIANLPTIDPQAILDRIKVLASDEFQGRAPGSPGEERTVQYLEGEFKKLGLKPGNTDGTYIQKVPLVGITAAPTSPLTISKGATKQVINWRDFKGVDVNGKTIVVLVNDPAVPDPANPGKLDPKTFGGDAMTYYGRWTYKFEEGARKGAAGVLIVHEEGPAGYPFSVVQGNLNEKFDLVTPDKNAGRAAIEGWVTLDAARKIFKMAGQDFDALKKQAATRDFKPVPLGLKASLAIRNTLRTIDSRNVVAKLDGSNPAHKDEYVVYSAHWDHFGIGTPVKGDKIYNGAADNASGVATVLEIARAFTQVKPAPRRSILFLLVTAEEQGLLGSQYYSVTPIYPLEKTLANINLDGLNQWGRTKDITVVGLGASDLDDYLKDAAAEQNRTLRPDPEPEKGFYYRSDHFNFAKQGVPALDPDAGIDYVGKSPDYGKKKRDEYNQNDYHAPSDQIKPDWDLSGAVDDAELLFAVGYRVANADTLPEWTAGNEFKAKRDEML